MEINKTLFARYAYLDEREQKALEDNNIGAYREASVALLEIINELEELGLEFKTIDDMLCLIAKMPKRQTQPRRSYQYPNAFKTIIEGSEGTKGYFVAWVVNVIGNTSLYGVIKYTMDNYRELSSVAWIESDAFGDDVEAAESWIHEKVAELQKNQ